MCTSNSCKNDFTRAQAIPRADATYHIIVGERRWRAAQKLGLKDVPREVSAFVVGQADVQLVTLPAR